MPNLICTRRLVLLAAAWLLGGCAGMPPDDTAQRLARLLPADVLLLGEQHDAPDHQRIQREVVQHLAERGQLAALVLEMAEQGVSTQGLPRDAGESQVQAALQWSEQAWPWPAYGPSIMAAVKAGLPVLGANLPRSQMRDRMNDASLDARLPADALQAQQAAVRLGHCDLLPTGQIAPMTRIQIARDIAMASTLQAAVAPGKTVVLLAGSGHVDRTLGVPRHLPAELRAVAIQLADPARIPPNTAPTPRFDHLWPARSAPEHDYCALLRAPRR